MKVARRALAWVLAFLLYAVAVGIASQELHLPKIGWGTEATAAIGLIVGLLVAFRTNSSYARWWEGRQLWGKLVNDTRNLALKVDAYLDPPEEDRRRFAAELSEFAVALRTHLREPANSPTHEPTEAARKIFATLTRWRQQGRVDTSMLRLLDMHAAGLMDVCGGCERIRNTPLPYSPKALLKVAFFFYLLTSPALVLGELGWWGLGPLGLGVFLLIALELAAEAMEEPFQPIADGLKLEQYEQTVATSARSILLDRRQ